MIAGLMDCSGSRQRVRVWSATCQSRTSAAVQIWRRWARPSQSSFIHSFGCVSLAQLCISLGYMSHLAVNLIVFLTQLSVSLQRCDSLGCLCTSGTRLTRLSHSAMCFTQLSHSAVRLSLCCCVSFPSTGECTLQHLWISDCRHRADEM